MKNDRNALKVLRQMEEYLHIKKSPERDNMNVYYLNKRGCEIVGQEEEYRWTQTVEHHLMRNDMYIHFGMPEGFIIEPEIQFGSGLTQKTIKPDAYFKNGDVEYFIEVDRTQKMIVNQQKIERYKELKPYMSAQQKLIFYTLSSVRRKKLQEWCSAAEIRCQIFTKEDL